MTRGVSMSPRSNERISFRRNPMSINTPDVASPKIYTLIVPKRNLPYRKYIPVQKDMSRYALNPFSGDSECPIKSHAYPIIPISESMMRYFTAVDILDLR